jgi:hypothetical protein
MGTNEHFPEDEEGRPSLDPRDPREATDPQTEATEAFLKAHKEEGGVEANRERLTNLLAGALRRDEESQELDHMAQGLTSEEAAQRVAADRERKLESLRSVLSEHPQIPGDATDRPGPQEPGGFEGDIDGGGATPPPTPDGQ